MPRRLIVTGASGFVAGSILRQAGAEWQVHALSGKPASLRRDGLTWHALDVLDTTALRQAFEAIRPAAVIHTAANADIDFCEKNRELAERVNVALAREVAALCREHGARLVHTSTDTVFDGEHAPYREADAAEPVNQYGRTKLAAEQTVRETLGDAVIARLAIVLGLSFSGGNSSLDRLITALRTAQPVPVLTEEVRTPIDVITLGRALLELAGSDFAGIIHLGGNSRMNRLDFSRLIAQQLGFPPGQIVPAPAAGIPGRARRPRDVSLDNQLARSTLRTPMLDLREGIELIMKHRPEPTT